jgi:tetratricopeptide (TPR) repeat protein
LSVRMTMQLGSDYLIAGQFDRAAAQFRRAIELEPHSPVLKGHGPNMELGIGHVHERERRYDEAFTEYLTRDSLNSASPEALLALRQAFAASGILGYWRMRGEQLERSVPPTDLLHLAWIWARVGEKEKAVHLIQRAYADRNPGMVYAGVLPDFAEVRKDARIQRILRRMGLRVVQP